MKFQYMKYIPLLLHFLREIIDNSNTKFHILKSLCDHLFSLLFFQKENEKQIPFQHNPKGTRYPQPVQRTQKTFLYRYAAIFRLQQIHPIQGSFKSL